jgi:hypothetical protein
LSPASVSVKAACPPPAPDPTITTSYSRFAPSADEIIDMKNPRFGNLARE